MRSYDAEIAEFLQAARKAADYGLVACSSGNLSQRIDLKTALLSASRAWLAELTAEQVAVCDIQTGKSLNDVTPTCESGFHMGILKHRPEMNVVLHFQSMYATTIACGRAESYNYNTTIEVPVYIGTPAVVGYRPPGSDELAQAVSETFSDKNIHVAILKNHGQIAVGKTVNDAIQKAVFFEMTCRILLTNPNAHPLSPETVNHLRQSAQA